MYTFSRSPTLKLLIATSINLALVVICQRYWSISSSHIKKQIQIEHERFFNEQLQLQQQQQQLQQLQYQKQQQQSDDGGRGPIEKETPLHSFKIPHDLYTTHDIAIPRDIPAWTAADTVSLKTAVGFDMMNQLLKPEYSKADQVTDPNRLDFAQSSRAERIYKSLWNYVYAMYKTLPDGGDTQEKEMILVKEWAQQRPEVDFLLRLEKKLYPWIHLHHRTSFSLYDSYKGQGKGVVFCAGNNQFEFIVSSIQAVRRLNPKLPIQVFHMGDTDLSPDRQKYVREMTSKIEVLDITQILDNGYMQLGGWSIKAFSLLASRFEEVMLIDSDAYFLRDPEELFEDPGYKSTGTLYFYDRTLGQDWAGGPDWLKSMMPIMSTFPPTTRMFRGLSVHEQESGVVVINKRERFQGLLAVCKMNSKWERDLWSYKVFYGDKETFWIGYEMVQEPYAFVKSYGGVIGEMRDDPRQENEILREQAQGQGSVLEQKKDIQRRLIDVPSVCGAQLHQDYLGRPMWWNGGLMRNKNEGIKRDLDFGFWMAGGGMQTRRERFVREKDMLRELMRDLGVHSNEEIALEPKDPVWIFEESCLYGEVVHKIDRRQKELTDTYLRMDRVGKVDEARLKAGDTVDATLHDWNAM
ncbi:hypothetical protein BGX28_004154 [Mortierella sp. GBA30]|nr:hypothetical protein BGX28_004154 [Mortierella sp. GBA30]